jgi:hypothetical protein
MSTTPTTPTTPTPQTDAQLKARADAATHPQEGPPPPTFPPTAAQLAAESAANARVEAAKKEAADAEAAARLAKAKLAPPPTSLDLTKPFAAHSTGVNEFTIHQAGFPLGHALSPHDSAIIVGWLNSVGQAR